MIPKAYFHIVLILSVLTSVSFESSAQNQEFGVFLGGSYYNGELNPGRQLIGVAEPAAGIFYDGHINKRYYMRFIGSYGKVTGNDRLTDIGLNNFRDLQFESRLLDFSAQIHFNFFPYGIGINAKPYTPYIFAGLAVYNVNPQVSSMSSDTATAFPKESYSTSLTSVAFPFGAGFKAIFSTLTIGLEWNFRKTFTDDFDGIENQYTVGNRNGEPVQLKQPAGFQKGILNTYDWYSFIGITLSYRPLPKKNACPGMN